MQSEFMEMGLRNSLLRFGLTILVMLGCAVVFPRLSCAEPSDAQMARNQFIQSLPVLPWSSVDETMFSDVQAPIQAMKNQYGGALLVSSGPSAETGGTFINLSSIAKGGLLNEPGLQFITLDFNESRRLQMVTLRFDRGWNDKNIAPLLERMSRRYGNLATPTVLGDPESEARDRVVLFEIGKFVVEVRLPQHGTYVSSTFTSKAILKRLRSIDGTLEIYKNYLDR